MKKSHSSLSYKKMAASLLIAIASALPTSLAHAQSVDPAALQTAMEDMLSRQPHSKVEPKFAALKVRMGVADGSEAEEKRYRRDIALKRAMASQLEDGTHLAHFTEAFQRILQVCNDGFDHIAKRQKSNVDRDFSVLVLAGAVGLISGGTGSLVAAKTAGVLGAGVAAYKQIEPMTPGTEYNNQTLQSTLDDIRNELSQSVTEFNRWFAMNAVGRVANAQSLQGLKLSLLNMNNACAFY